MIILYIYIYTRCTIRCTFFDGYVRWDFPASSHESVRSRQGLESPGALEYFPKEVHKAVPAYSFASKNASERKPENRPSIGGGSEWTPLRILYGIPRDRTGKKDENDIDIDFYR